MATNDRRAEQGRREDGAPEDRIRVLVVDDHHRYRDGLRAVLGLDRAMVVVGEAADGEEALEACRRLHPDVALLDVRMPRGSGVEACGRIRQELPSVRVLMLSASDDEGDLFAAIRAGAHGYLLKDDAGEEVLDAIRRVRGGQGVVPPQLAAALLEEFSRLGPWASFADTDDGRPRLTERETDVLRLIARGMTNRQIASHLTVSENTVKNHVRNILDKLHLHSRTEAAVYAHRRRIPGAGA